MKGEQGSLILGVMDVGSQTVRAAAVQWDGVRLTPIFSERRNLRIGARLTSMGDLGKEAILRAEQTFQDLGRLFREVETDYFRGVGTAALREARDASRFLDMARSLLPGEIVVVSQEEEAGLAMKGVVATLPQIASKDFIVMDVGGGSTEIMLHSPGAPPQLLAGLPLGAVTLFQDYCHNDPPTSSQWEDMVMAVRDAVAGHGLPRGLPCVGVGGTACLLASLHLELSQYDPRWVRGLYLSLNELDLTASLLLSHNLEGRRRIPGMEPDRADIAVAGVAICVTLLRHLAADGFWISDGGLLMGLLVDLIEKELDTHVESSCTAGLYL